METSSMNYIFEELNNKANLLYKFIMLYSDYAKAPHDYGTGYLINMVEVHTLTAIEENPGITVTLLASMWNRTKGAISQTISKLEKRGLVQRKKEESNAKTVYLYVTEAGLKLSRAHKLYDTMDVTRTMQELLKNCTMEEIDSFYKVVESYIRLFS